MNSHTLGDSDDRFERLEALIKADGVETRQQVAQVQASLEAVKATVAKVYVRVEDLHGQIKLIGEGHSALTDHIIEVKGGIERLEAGQGQLDLRMRSLESRQGRLERVQK